MHNSVSQTFETLSKQLKDSYFSKKKTVNKNIATTCKNTFLHLTKITVETTQKSSSILLQLSVQSLLVLWSLKTWNVVWLRLVTSGSCSSTIKAISLASKLTISYTQQTQHSRYTIVSPIQVYNSNTIIQQSSHKVKIISHFIQSYLIKYSVVSCTDKFSSAVKCFHCPQILVQNTRFRTEKLPL